MFTMFRFMDVGESCVGVPYTMGASIAMSMGWLMGIIIVCVALPAIESLFSYVRFTPTVDEPTSASRFTDTLNSTSAVSPGFIALTYAASLLPTVSVSPFELASERVATFFRAVSFFALFMSVRQTVASSPAIRPDTSAPFTKSL